MNKILLIGMPRSGTSWLSQIFDSSPDVRFKLDPLFSYKFKNVVNEESSLKDWNIFLDSVYLCADDFMDQTEKRRLGYYPTFDLKDNNPDFLVIKTTRYHHLLPFILKNNLLKVIFIVRNPCGSINSWLKSKGEFPETADIYKNWKSGNCRKTSIEEFWGFDDWISTTKSALKLKANYPESIKILHYDFLVENTGPVVRELFKWCDLPYSDQTHSFIRACNDTHIDDQYAVYKSKRTKDKWREELDVVIKHEIIQTLKNTRLEKFLND